MPLILLCPYDETSTRKGASEGARVMIEALAPHIPGFEVIEVGNPETCSAIYCRQLREYAAQDPWVLALGGDQLITFPLLEVCKAAHPKLKLVTFDAYPDAPEHPLLTNESFAFYARYELGIETLVVGARAGLEEAADGVTVLSHDEIEGLGDEATAQRIMAFVGDDPFYLSVDLQVLDPLELPAVSRPALEGMSADRLQALLQATLQRRPVAVDVTELNPLRGGGFEDVLELVLEPVASWLQTLQ